VSTTETVPADPTRLGLTDAEVAALPVNTPFIPVYHNSPNQGLSPDFFQLSDPIGGVASATPLVLLTLTNPSLGYGPNTPAATLASFSAANPPAANYPTLNCRF